LVTADILPPPRQVGNAVDAALTDLFNLDQARSRSPSFDGCYRVFECLLRALMPAPVAGEEPTEQGD
jgi:hypothetical protein